MEHSRLDGIVGAPFNVLGPPHHRPPFIPVHPPIPIIPPPPPNNTNIVVNVTNGGSEGQNAIDREQDSKISLILNKLETLSGIYYSITSGIYDRNDIDDLLYELSNLSSNFLELKSAYDETIQNLYGDGQIINHILPQQDDDYDELNNIINDFGDDINSFGN